MKCRHQMPALFDQHRVTLILCQNPHIGARAPDDGSADEDRFHIARTRALLKIGVRVDVCDPAVDLPPVPVAFDSEVHQAKALLSWIVHFLREQNRSRARTEDGFLTRELEERFFQIHEVDELEHGGTLAPGYHKAVDAFKFFGGPNEDGFRTRAFERSCMRFEIALQR